MLPFFIIITILLIVVILPAWPSWQIYVSVWEGRGVFYICRWDHRRMSSSHKLAPKFATIPSHTGHICRVQADTVCYREIARCATYSRIFLSLHRTQKTPMGPGNGWLYLFTKNTRSFLIIISTLVQGIVTKAFYSMSWFDCNVAIQRVLYTSLVRRVAGAI